MSSLLIAFVPGLIMAKKASADNLAPGARVQVRSGVTVPEFTEVSCAGWTGVVIELVGKKADAKCVVEWDEGTVAQMPRSYVEQCEKQNLFYRMACLARSDLEPLG